MSAILLELPVEVWDRILFWMSLLPADVANFAKASVLCHFLVFGPVGDRNEHNVLQHGALLGARIADQDSFHFAWDVEVVYQPYIQDSDDVDRALLAVLRMNDRRLATRTLETALALDPPDEEEVAFDSDGEQIDFSDECTFHSLLEGGQFTPRTRGLLCRVAAEFGPADFSGEGARLIRHIGALADVVYPGLPDEWIVEVAQFAAIGGHPQTLAQLLTLREPRQLADMEIIATRVLRAAVRVASLECFEVALAHITSVNWGYGYGAYVWSFQGLMKGLIDSPSTSCLPYYSLLFRAVSEGKIPSPPDGTIQKYGELLCWPFLSRRDEAAELMSEVAKMPGIQQEFCLSLQGQLIRYGLRYVSVLYIVERAIGAGVPLPFSLLDLAAKVASPKYPRILEKIVFRSKVSEGGVDWLALHVLIPLCRNRDWAGLQREIEELAEDCPQETIKLCFQALSRRLGGSRENLELVAVFSPWI
jgi:hypothetical protein